ncbi:TA system VapC family ribonuclease toxin [Aquibium sp. ELW1220]|uniref:TA system VapC family ribonuclease toxin n=1 Tax=Aquibium sp. ELW1220 TaxID=2976766 RepID=UPI0025B0A1EF|nr:TA system VapC family ribonuclease toxin [Aquibium sp. ELW1220]MDN2581276.1 VapC toxin family PIN domain ribonuclease [Aquibium sp. ELW1220]
MRSLLDVNVLLALFDPIHVHHEKAHRWWAGNADAGWATCPLTQTGFLRIISNPSYPSPITLLDAHSILFRQPRASGHAFWTADISFSDPARFDFSFVRSPKQLTDIYLLALAVSNSGRLVTFDARVSPAPVLGAATEHLVVLR